MKICPHCESNIISTAKFCDQCGKEQSVFCKKCGLELRSTAKFCEECGTGVTIKQTNTIIAKQSVVEKQQVDQQVLLKQTKASVTPTQNTQVQATSLPSAPKLAGAKQGIAAYRKNVSTDFKSLQSTPLLDDDIVDFGTMIQNVAQQDNTMLNQILDTGNLGYAVFEDVPIQNTTYGNQKANCMGGYGFNGYSPEPKGNVAYNDGWVYLFDVARKNANTLAKMREDGTEFQILYIEEAPITEDFLVYLNVDDTYIYYTYAQNIVRIKKDGSERQVLASNAHGSCYANLILMEDTLYFSYAGSDNDALMPTIFSVKTDGTSFKKIITIKDCFPNHNIITGTNTWLSIFSINPQKIICDMRVRFFNNKGDFDRSSMKYMMNLDGTQIQAVPTLFDYTKLLDEIGEVCQGSMMEHFSKLISHVDLDKNMLYLNTKHTIYQLHMKTQLISIFLTDLNANFQSINGYFNGVSYVDVLLCHDNIKRLTIFDATLPSRVVDNTQKSWWYNIAGDYVYWHAGIENFQVAFCRVKLDGTGYEELYFKKQ